MPTTVALLLAPLRQELPLPREPKFAQLAARVVPRAPSAGRLQRGHQARRVQLRTLVGPGLHTSAAAAAVVVGDACARRAASLKDSASYLVQLALLLAKPPRAGLTETSRALVLSCSRLVVLVSLGGRLFVRASRSTASREATVLGRVLLLRAVVVPALLPAVLPSWSCFPAFFVK